MHTWRIKMMKPLLKPVVDNDNLEDSHPVLLTNEMPYSVIYMLNDWETDQQTLLVLNPSVGAAPYISTGSIALSEQSTTL